MRGKSRPTTRCGNQCQIATARRLFGRRKWRAYYGKQSDDALVWGGARTAWCSHYRQPSHTSFKLKPFGVKGNYERMSCGRSEQALGRALIIKLTKIHSDIRGIYEYLDHSLQKDPKAEPWQLVRALASLPTPVRFTSEELSMLMGLDNNDVFNSVLNMDVAHDSTLELVRRYNSERKNLLNEMPTSSVQGIVVESVLKPEQEKVLRIPMNTVNELADALCDHAKRKTRESGQALHDLCELLQDKLGLGHRMEAVEGVTAEDNPSG